MSKAPARRGVWLMMVCVGAMAIARVAGAEPPPPWLADGKFSWTTGGPVVAPISRPADPCVSVKDPSIVFHDGRWHLFMTIRSKVRTHSVEYCSFDDFAKADRAERHILTSISEGYFCAPQVFYFLPHKKWYMVYQTSDKTRKSPWGPAFSTNDDISRPGGWTRPTFFYPDSDEKFGGLDFWVICDDTHAYLFFTNLKGAMLRARTKLEDFPAGWSKPEVCLQADIFEASHTYQIKGMNKYLTVIEAQGGKGRYYKAYLADALDGPWRPLADSLQKPFAAFSNIKQEKPWTDQISHVELLRDGNDERMEIDPARLRVLFQGCTEKEYRGNAYGAIPWRLGVLEMTVR